MTLQPSIAVSALVTLLEHAPQVIPVTGMVRFSPATLNPVLLIAAITFDLSVLAWSKVNFTQPDLWQTFWVVTPSIAVRVLVILLEQPSQVIPVTVSFTVLAAVSLSHFPQSLVSALVSHLAVLQVDFSQVLVSAFAIGEMLRIVRVVSVCISFIVVGVFVSSL